MIRQVIKIEADKCIGCGLCASACHEGAIGIMDGKAKLLKDDYCDGLGNCLPKCPTGAITFEKREAAPYNKAIAPKRLAVKPKAKWEKLDCGCPESHSKAIARVPMEETEKTVGSQLQQWPCQIKLVPVNAPYFDKAHLLIAADCTAYAYGDFHNVFIKNKITLIGCPKLDEGDYTEKLTEILAKNEIKSVTITRMEVPCCGGLEQAVKNALKNCGKMIPWNVVIITTNGMIRE